MIISKSYNYLQVSHSSADHMEQNEIRGSHFKVATCFPKETSNFIVFLRHGESLWNKEKKFTGWSDVPLTQVGLSSATQESNSRKEQESFSKNTDSSSISHSHRTFREPYKPATMQKKNSNNSIFP
jgi:hypothetical protein